jgi:hypothetical protein
MKLFSVECPRCLAAIPFLRVKPRFACGACAAPLLWVASDDFPQTANWPPAAWIGLSCFSAIAFYGLLAPRAKSGAG